MRPVLDRCDSDGLPAYLEASSERSAALYERLGFVHLGVLELPDGGPPMWPMRRPPAGARPPRPREETGHRGARRLLLKEETTSRPGVTRPPAG
jgi:hypothetical protein